MKTTQSRDGTILAYDIYGGGPPLFFITGASCFRNFMPVLKDAKGFAKFFIYLMPRVGQPFRHTLGQSLMNGEYHGTLNV